MRVLLQNILSVETVHIIFLHFYKWSALNYSLVWKGSIARTWRNFKTARLF